MHDGLIASGDRLGNYVSDYVARFAHHELTGDLPHVAMFLNRRRKRYVKTFSVIIRYLVHIHAEATKMRSIAAQANTLIRPSVTQRVEPLRYAEDQCTRKI